MMLRRKNAVILAVLALALVAVPTVQAQEGDYVTVEEPSFMWTGKEDMTANFSWSAMIANPYKRPVSVEVTLVLLDGSGDVVATDSEMVEVGKEGNIEVGSDGSLPYAEADRARQWRVAVASAETS